MNLIASTSTFSFFTLISRILGYARDILIAIFLGTGLLADAFFVAFRLPNTFRRLFAEGAFNAAFVPSYTGELVQSKEQANDFAKNIFNLPYNKISILTHPNSYIHAIIKFKNGLIKILAHEPDMKIPIFNSLYDTRLRSMNTKPINIKILNNLNCLLSLF